MVYDANIAVAERIDKMSLFYLSLTEKEVDKKSFEEIYHKYEKNILRRVGKILQDEEDIKDAMQNTWLGVLNSMDLFPDMDEKSIQSYIMTIARNQSVSILRRKGKESEIFVDMDSVELIDDTDLFELCSTEDISNVKACIDMLSNTQKEVIVLYYLYNRSLKEIAQLFNISESVAESRWNHGRLRLIQLLQRKGIYEKKEHERI